MNAPIIVRAINFGTIGLDNNNIVTKEGYQVTYLYIETLTATYLLSDISGLDLEYKVKYLGKSDHNLGIVQISIGDIDLIYKGNNIQSIIINVDKFSRGRFENMFSTDFCDESTLRDILGNIYSETMLLNEYCEWKLIDTPREFRVKHSEDDKSAHRVNIYNRVTQDNKRQVCLDINIGMFSYIKPDLVVTGVEIKAKDLTFKIDKRENNFVEVYSRIVSTLGFTKMKTIDKHDICYFNIGSNKLILEGTSKNNIKGIAFNIKQANNIIIICNNSKRYNLGDLINKVVMLDNIGDFDKIGFRDIQLFNVGALYRSDNLYRLELYFDK